MKKKILMSLFTIALVGALIGGGVIAYFSDTETSEGNVFQAGTIDLEMSVDEIVLGTFTFLDIKPCEDMEPIVIKLTNVGQNNGFLYQKISYVNFDKEPVGEFFGDISADKFAALIYVKSITYQHSYEGYTGSIQDDLPGMIAALDSNGDGKVSLYEMQCNWMPYSDVYPEDPYPYNPEHTLQVLHTGTWTIVFHMADSLEGWALDGHLLFNVVDNRPQADGIQITWTAVLSQNPGIPS